MNEGLDARLYLVPPGDGEEYRLGVFEVNPRLFRWMIDRKVTISGLPSDAEYVRSWHDPERDLFCMVFRSREFGSTIPCVPPLPSKLIVFEELPEV